MPTTPVASQASRSPASSSSSNPHPPRQSSGVRFQVSGEPSFALLRGGVEPRADWAVRQSRMRASIVLVLVLSERSERFSSSILLESANLSAANLIRQSGLWKRICRRHTGDSPPARTAEQALAHKRRHSWPQKGPEVARAVPSASRNEPRTCPFRPARLPTPVTCPAPCFALVQRATHSSTERSLQA